MAWALAVLLLIVAAGFYAVRAKFSTFQSLVFGGRISPGCVVAEVALLVFVAVLVVIARLAGVIH